MRIGYENTQEEVMRFANFTVVEGDCRTSLESFQSYVPETFQAEGHGPADVDLRPMICSRNAQGLRPQQNFVTSVAIHKPVLTC